MSDKSLNVTMDIRTSTYDSRDKKIINNYYAQAEIKIHNTDVKDSLTIGLDGKEYSLSTLEEILSTAKTLLLAQEVFLPKESELPEVQGEEKRWKIVYENKTFWDSILINAVSREEAIAKFKAMNIPYTDVTDVEEFD